jgi:hypothetical protein
VVSLAGLRWSNSPPKATLDIFRVRIVQTRANRERVLLSCRIGIGGEPSISGASRVAGTMQMGAGETP